jgi:hypothetical protein
MIKGTTKRASRMAFVVLALGCGGKAETLVSASVGGSDAASGAAGVAVAGSSAAGAPTIHDEIGRIGGAPAIGDGTPGVGPINPSGLPTQLPVDCPGMAPPPQIALPCKVGMSATTYNPLECYNLVGNPVFSFVFPFASLSTMLNQPIQLASFFPGPPGNIVSGTLVFSQIDPVGRAFVARLTGGTISWTANEEPITCTIPDAPFWAVAGNFTSP